MARDYGKVTHQFWTGETGKKIRARGLEARVVATYLLTCSSSNMIGLYYIPVALIAHEAGTTLEETSKALRSLSEVDFAHYDEDAELVFVPHMARVQIGESLKTYDKQRAGVIAQLKEYKNHKYVAAFVAIYKDAYHLPDDLIAKPPQSPFEAPSKPESRDQGSESREQKTDPPSACACDPSTTEYAARRGDHWLSSFGAAWFEKNGRQYGRASADSRSAGELTDLLSTLPHEEVLSLWDRRKELFREFFESADQRTVKAGLQFSFFVAGFRGAMLPESMREKARASPRPRVRGSVPDEW